MFNFLVTDVDMQPAKPINWCQYYLDAHLYLNLTSWFIFNCRWSQRPLFWISKPFFTSHVSSIRSNFGKKKKKKLKHFLWHPQIQSGIQPDSPCVWIQVCLLYFFFFLPYEFYITATSCCLLSLWLPPVPFRRIKESQGRGSSADAPRGNHR